MDVIFCPCFIFLRPRARERHTRSRATLDPHGREGVQCVDTAPHALPGQQAAGRLAHAGPHGMHARRNGPCMHESVQAQPHAHFTDHMYACMHMHTLGHVGSWLAQSYVRVRCTLGSAYSGVRTYTIQEERSVVALRTCS